MGKIIESKVLSNNVLYKIILGQDEVLALKNSIKNVNVFSADVCNSPVKIIKKGKGGVSQFFEIPFNLRIKKKKNFHEITYQKLEVLDKIFYIYVIQKDRIGF